MKHHNWAVRFQEIHTAAVRAYGEGRDTPATMFTREQVAWLAEIGCTAQELFDFVEDFCNGGEPPFPTVLLITAVRRDYFLTVQKGKPSGRIIDMDALPPKSQEVDGIAWLPRLIVKARAKLRGEMPPELMYGCGGDRPFCRRMNVDLPDLLLVTWRAGDNDREIIDYVKRQAGMI